MRRYALTHRCPLSDPLIISNDTDLEENSEGDWVRYSDAEKLQAQRDDAMATISTMATEQAARRAELGAEIANIKERLKDHQRAYDSLSGSATKLEARIKQLEIELGQHKATIGLVTDERDSWRDVIEFLVSCNGGDPDDPNRMLPILWTLDDGTDFLEGCLHRGGLDEACQAWLDRSRKESV